MKIAMYGSGAAGSVFASYLKNGGADIILIDRYEAHMKKVAEDGMNFIIHRKKTASTMTLLSSSRASAPTPPLRRQPTPKARSTSSST